MAIPKNPESHSPIAQVSKNEPTESAEEITNLFGLTTSEQIEIPMESGKRGQTFASKPAKKGKLPPDSSLKPEKRIKQAYQELKDKLADDLLKKIMENSPWFFEQLVLKLLHNMGYGNPDSEKPWNLTPKTKDGGIDGVIQQDELGFDQIYVQAKRWKADITVSKQEIQQFSGALSSVKATKGLFITTSKFSKDATEEAEKHRIVLVDGKRLTELMIKYNVGVSTVSTYEIKAVDTDFFNNGEIS